MEQYDYYHILRDKDYGGWNVKGYGRYGRSSVLAGQVKIVFLDHFETLEEAQKAYPSATLSNELLEPRNTFDHLPDEPDTGWN